MSKQLFPYCVGIVAIDMEVNSREAEIFPLEKLPNVEGEFTEPEKIEGEYEDDLKKKHSYTLEKSNTLTAKWLPIGWHNRLTAPNMCKGEYVMLYKYAGEDSYFWIPLFTETHLRKKESVMHFYSNKAKIMEQDDENLAKRGYFTLIDTLGQIVHLHTDKDEDAEEDPEKAGYDVSFSGMEGHFLLQDTEENSFKLSSVEGHMDINLNGNLKLTMPSKSPNGEEEDKGNIYIEAEGDYEFKLPNKDHGNITVEAQGDYTFKLPNSDKGNITIEAQGDYSLKLPNKGNITIDAKGDTKINIDKGVKGDITKNIELEFDKIKLSNGANELISLLVDLVQEIIDMMHMGNQGAPTKIHPASQAKFVALKTKFSGFKV